MNVAWALIVIAGFLEPCWVYTMEKSDNLKKWNYVLVTVALLIIDMFLLSQAMNVIGPGTSYAVWTGIGAVCTLIMGITLFEDSISWVRIFFVMIIIAGIVGLNLTSGAV